MRALKKARKLIETHPESRTAQVLSTLVVALESDQPMKLSELYELGYDDFALAIDVMSEWRLDRYYTSKAVLLDLSLHRDEVTAAEASAPASSH